MNQKQNISPGANPEDFQSNSSYLQKVADLSPNILFVIDLPNKKILYVNQRVKELLGKETTEIYSEGLKILKSVVHPDDYERRLENLNKCKGLADEEETEVEVRLRVVSEEWQWFRITDKIFERGENGKVSTIIGTAQNIHESKTYKEKLKEEHRKFQNAQAIGNIGSFERKLPGDLVTYSEEFYRILGLDPKEDEIGIQEFMSHVHPEDRRDYQAAIDYTHSTGEPLDMVTRVIRADGEIRHVHRRAAIMYDEKGKPAKVYGTVQDITQRIIAEEERKKLEWLMRSTENVAGTGSYELDLLTNKVYLSNGLYRLLDEEPGEIEPTQEWLDNMSHPEDAAKVQEILKAAAVTKNPYTYIRRIYRKNGEMRILEAQGNVIIDAEGNPVKMIGLVQDVTDRKRAERELLNLKDEMAQRAADSEDRFRSLITASSDIVYKMSADWETLYALEGKNFLSDTAGANHSWINDYIPNSDRPRLMNAIRQSIETQGMFELEHQVFDVDGNIRWVHSRAIPKLNDKGEIVEWLGAAHNITARKKAEKRQFFLLKLSDRLGPLVDSNQIQKEAMRLVAGHFDADRAFYYEIDSNNWATTSNGFSVDGKTLPQKFPVSNFGEPLLQAFNKGEAIVVGNVYEDDRFTGEDQNSWKENDITSGVAIPFIKEGILIAALGINTTCPRTWAEDEVELLGEVAERTWAAVERAKVEKVLKENEERLLQAMEAGNQFGWEVDLETGNVTYSGDQRAVLGFQLPDSLMGRFSLIHPDDLESSKEAYRHSVKNKTPLSIVQRLVAPGTIDKTVWTRVEGKFFGNPPKFIGTTRNINEEKKAEERQAYLLHLSDGLRSLDNPEEIQLQAAKILGEYLGAARVGYAEDLGDGKSVAVTRNYTNGVSGIEGVYSYGDYGLERLKKLLEGQSIVRGDIAGDPNLTSAEKEAHAIRDLAATVNIPLIKKNKLQAILFIHFIKPHHFTIKEVALIEDTADRIWAAVEKSRAEQALREAQESLSIALEAAQMGTWDLNMANSTSKRNFRHDQIFGYDEPQLHWNIEIAKKHVLREDHHIYERAYATALETGKLQLEVRVRWRDDSIHWMEVNGHFYFDENGIPVRAAGVNLEVTDRRQAEQALRESEQRFRNLVEASALAVWETDPEGNIIVDSPSWRKFTGQTYEEWKGTGWKDAVHPEDREAAVIDWQKAVNSRQNFDYEFRLRSANGSYRWTNIKAIPILDLDGNVTKWSGMNLDIHNKKEAEEDLRKAKEEAEEASRAKEDFVSTMSHEIRTPLNAIIGLTNLLIEKKPREDQKDNLNSLSFSAKNLLVLINEILDFSKLEAGKMEISENDFSLPDLLSNLQKAHQPQATANGTVIILNLSENIPQIIATDQVKLSQILHNLVSNAVKFTKKGKVEIIVALNRQDKDLLWLDFAVQDTGIGIAANKADHIFDKFAQAESSTVRNYGGTGLGLSISKLLLELMGSEIKLESKLGEGSRFYFTLPARIGLKENTPMEIGELPEEKKNFSHLRLLLVEDVEINRKIIMQFLQNWWKLEPDEATNGKEAVEKAKIHRYDLILMDIRMPEMDGYEATTKIRQLPGYKKTPILALTADKNQAVQQAGQATKFSDMLTKPFEPRDLRQRILQHLSVSKKNLLDQKTTYEKDAGKVGGKDLQLSTNPGEISKEPSYDITRFVKLSGGNREVLEKLMKNTLKAFETYKSEFQTAASEENLHNLSDLIHKNTTSIHYVQANQLAKQIEEYRELLKTLTPEKKKVEKMKISILSEFDKIIKGLNSFEEENK